MSRGEANLLIIKISCSDPLILTFSVIRLCVKDRPDSIYTFIERQILDRD